MLYAAPEALDGMLAAYFAREERHEYAAEADGSIGRMTYYDLDTLASFVSMVWMNHPFMDGNTRTTATFLILYLRSMGFDVDNTLFEEEASYFRGALVRACYQNGRAGVRPTREYLDLFLSKLLKDPEARLNHDELWCREMFHHPDLVRNADSGAARVMQERLLNEGITERVLNT